MSYGRDICRRRDLNPHGFLHTILSRARMPIPPLRQFLFCPDDKILRHGRELNPRITLLQSVALPLGYRAILQNFMSGSRLHYIILKVRRDRPLPYHLATRPYFFNNSSTRWRLFSPSSISISKNGKNFILI